MEAFDLAPLITKCEKENDRYLEFIRKPTISVGLYMLPAGAVDGQAPHSEDEIYYVISGRGSIFVDNENRDVQAGSVIFVGAHAEHRFHSIAEDMTMLVAFAPAEYTNAPATETRED
ncbi:MAG: cupin domain-containing protein [Chloroflexota bacterium]|nr:cupin domain-containing protein [Chloroflexota bacterium]